VIRRLAVIGLVAAGLAVLVSQVDVARIREGVDANLSGVKNADYTVDAIFDTAKGLLPGQLVKIAGARAGTITKVSLTPDYKARIEMRIDDRFRPFRADAKCAIRPEGLIGERFIQCDPGSRGAKALAGAGDGAPTIPVENTALPVDLTELFRIFNSPSRDRLSVVVNTLGLATAGRGDDVNEIIRRANPTLASMRRLLGVIDGQREQLQSSITDSQTVLAELARRRDRVGDFLDQAARVSGQTADHSSQLADAIHRLPGLLDQAQPALERLHGVATQADPVLADLRAAAPGLKGLVDRAEPFTATATPVVDDLRAVLPKARTAVRTATPAVRQLRTFAAKALPAGEALGALTINLRDRGFADNLLRMTYRIATSNARFDQLGHLSEVQLMLQAPCATYQTKPSATCDARYHPTTSSPSSRSQRSSTKPAAGQPKPSTSPKLPELPTPKLPQLPELPKPKLPKLPPVPKLPPLPKVPPVTVPQPPPVTVPKLPDVGQKLGDVTGGKGNARRRRQADALLDYLLK
jgi:virulence factor Mce-like protein